MKERELYDLYMERTMSVPIPEVSLPVGFAIRNVTEEDGYLWEQVMDKAFGNYEPGDFRYIMVHNHDYEEDRVFVMFDADGKPVATASSWRQHYRWGDNGVGYVIFVGVVPEYRGHSLAQQMVNFILHDFKRKGFHTALLNVEENNLPAIKTYTNCGFKPCIISPEHIDAWSEQFQKLKLAVPEYNKGCRLCLDVPHPAPPYPYALRMASEAEENSDVWVHGSWERHNMFKLDTSEFYRVKPWFAGIDGCDILIEDMQKNGGGSIFVDRTLNPSAALIAADDTFCYIAGNAECKDFIDGVMTYLINDIIPTRKEGDKQVILFSSADEWKAELDKRLVPYGGFRIRRYAFKFDEELFRRCKTLLKALPDEYSISVKCENSRIKACINSEGRVVSCCEGVMYGDGQVEINIYTDYEHRRKGLAENVCAAFIEQCLQTGQKPHWSCWDYNTPSLDLAQKLGFVRLPDLEVNFCEMK